MIAKYVEKLLGARAHAGERPEHGQRTMMTNDAAARRSGSTPSSSAIADIAAGKAVVVVDDEDRENEGDLIFAASQGDARS